MKLRADTSGRQKHNSSTQEKARLKKGITEVLKGYE